MAEEVYLEKVQRLIKRGGYDEVISFQEIKAYYERGLSPKETAQEWVDSYE